MRRCAVGGRRGARRWSPAGTHGDGARTTPTRRSTSFPRASTAASPIAAERRRRRREMYDGLTPLFDQVTAGRPDHLLQVRGASASAPTAPSTIETVPRPGVDDRARLLQRPPRHRRDPRRRRLGRRLDRRRGPRPAAPAGPLQRPRRRDRRARAQRDRPDQRAAELRSPAPRPRPRSRSRPQVLEAAGPEGQAVLHDIDVFISGINDYLAAQQPGDRALDAQRHLRPQRAQGPVPRPGRRRRGAALAVPRRAAAAARQEEGHERLQRPAPVQEPRAADLGRRPLPLRHDPEEAPRAAWSSTPAASTATPGGRRARGAGADAGADPGVEHADDHGGAARRPGEPLMVGGPQIGYFYPGLTYEIDMHAGDLQWRGATSAPVPRLPADRPRRGLRHTR